MMMRCLVKQATCFGLHGHHQAYKRLVSIKVQKRGLFYLWDPIVLLYKRHNKNRKFGTKQAYAEMRTIRNIKAKLSLHNATILKADKGNTFVICYVSSYYSKTQEFITNNQNSTINNDPTNSFQKEKHPIGTANLFFVP